MRHPAASSRRARLGASLTVGALACAMPLVGSVAASAAPGDVTVSAVQPVDLVHDGDQIAVRVRVDVEGGGDVTGQVSVRYRTSGGTATSGTDYRPAEGTLDFPAGTPSGAVRSFLLDTRTTPGVETAETVGVTLEPSGATLSG
jgi:beta-glucosidase